MREVKVYTRLPSHERLLKMISYNDDEINGYVVLEYLSGGTLAAYLASTAEVTPEQQLKWCIEATDGVAFLHDFGIIHSDIKPENMLLGPELSIRIIDFSGSSVDGLKPLGLESTRYFLPRPMDSGILCSRYTDLFALGSSLYHIMHRVPPYQDRGDDEVEELYEQKLFPDLRGVACGDIIGSCWHQKLSSANDVLALLYMQQRPVGTFSSLVYIGYRSFLGSRSWLRRCVAYLRFLCEKLF